MANNKQISIYQHYVPRCYLKNFSMDGKYVYVCFKPKTEFKKQLINNICGENFFYDISKKEAADFCQKYNLGIDLNNLTQKEIAGNQPVEHFLAEQIESKLFSFIRKVINVYSSGKFDYETTVFSKEDKFIWSLFSVFQFFRTSSFRNNLGHSLQNPTQEIIKVMEQYQSNTGVDCSKQIKEAKQTIEKFAIRKIHISQLKDINFMTGMARIHYGMYKWLIGVADDDAFFITTDNPTTFFARYEKPLNDLYFPISDKLCFILHPMSCKNSELFNDCSFIRIKSNIVKMINLALMKYSDRLIISKYKLNLETYINSGINDNLKEAIRMLDYGDGFCTIVKIEPIQIHPGSIFDFLDLNEFHKFGREKKDAPLLYVNLLTKVYRLGYYGSFFFKPVDGRVISQNEFIERYNKIEPMVLKLQKDLRKQR